MTIIVTQEDIDKGDRNSPCNCPVAKAATRAFGFDMNASRTWIREAGTINIIEVPVQVTQFIQDFDSGNPVKPFSFRVG